MFFFISGCLMSKGREFRIGSLFKGVQGCSRGVQNAVLMVKEFGGTSKKMQMQFYRRGHVGSWVRLRVFAVGFMIIVGKRQCFRWEARLHNHRLRTSHLAKNAEGV
jgi:hypothetical protein